LNTISILQTVSKKGYITHIRTYAILRNYDPTGSFHPYGNYLMKKFLVE
jgi:hypothetical protein